METELRQLLRKIEEEYEAAYSGMYAFSSGTSRHEFMNAKMENVGRYGVELTKLVGEEEAARLIVQKNDKDYMKGKEVRMIKKATLRAGLIISYRLLPHHRPTHPEKEWHGKILRLHMNEPGLFDNAVVESIEPGCESLVEFVMISQIVSIEP